jgi:hypothetical protein
MECSAGDITDGDEQAITERPEKLHDEPNESKAIILSSAGLAPYGAGKTRRF